MDNDRIKTYIKGDEKILICYKSLRLVNGKPKWILKDENYDIIKSPTMGQIKSSLFEEDRPKRCCICGGYESYIDPGTGENGNYYYGKDNAVITITADTQDESYDIICELLKIPPEKTN